MLNARKKQQKPVRVGLIGAGKFGSMILSQARHIEGLIISAVADPKKHMTAIKIRI